jgi:hypothetical protein
VVVVVLCQQPSIEVGAATGAAAGGGAAAGAADPADEQAAIATLAKSRPNVMAPAR